MVSPRKADAGSWFCACFNVQDMWKVVDKTIAHSGFYFEETSRALESLWLGLVCGGQINRHMIHISIVLIFAWTSYYHKSISVLFHAISLSLDRKSRRKNLSKQYGFWSSTLVNENILKKETYYTSLMWVAAPVLAFSSAFGIQVSQEAQTWLCVCALSP